jgi:hypothetical protein
MDPLRKRTYRQAFKFFMLGTTIFDTMRGTTESKRRGGMTVIIIAAVSVLAACSSDPPPPPELTPAMASSLLSQKWAQEEMNHFRVTFHSEELIECGVKNDLWKLVEITDSSGHAWSTAYRLTEKGSKVLSSIDLKESGRGHEIVLRGPYRSTISGIGDGSQPGAKKVGLRWEVDWDKAPADLKTCLPRFELSGNKVALFALNGLNWTFVSYLEGEDAAMPQGNAGSVLDKLK